MNSLTVFTGQNKPTINSREVADMVNKRHDHLIRDIRGYVDIMKNSTKPKIGVSDFFLESTYQNSQNKTQPCYECTKKGCEMIAHKMTGEKGVVFTAAYIDRFHEMEQRLIPQTLPEALRLYADALEANKTLQIELDSSKEWYSIKRVAALNGVGWKRFNWRKLKAESERQGIPARKVFDANYSEVNVYHQSVWAELYPQYEL